MEINKSVIERTLARKVDNLLSSMGVERSKYMSGTRESRSPVTGTLTGYVSDTSIADVPIAIGEAHEAYLQWRCLPAPKRGELVRLLGEELRAHKDALAQLVCIEVGKIHSEGLGEVQEMIDICEFAVGLSRQLLGSTIATERHSHRMMETWHPLGITGVISAFNFPVAVWSWNAALALVCGNSVVWKPSEKAPLTAMATEALFRRALSRFVANGGSAPDNLLVLLMGGSEVGSAVVDDTRVPLVSATGSVKMGRIVAPRLARRFARALLELGGNNAAIVTPSADIDLTVRAVAFAAMGTAGQRCTSLRRLIVHCSIYASFIKRLKKAFSTAAVGNPLESDTLIGPLIDEAAYLAMTQALVTASAAGGSVTGGERVLMQEMPNAFYVRPALVEMPTHAQIMSIETFAPILYVITYEDLDDAIRWQNDVPQGLASAIFTTDLREAELFMSTRGSDCGITNVNIGPSGAEIGGAFGGEKETGGGREAGSDSWKAYMRRATNTINYGASLTLAQGVTFDVA